jgi:tRNA pseudouridine55 synthase
LESSAKQEGHVLLINKELHWTSFDVVNKIRKLLVHYGGNKHLKVGHAGTLDPLATGLVILCTGNATKQMDHFLMLDKEYIATIEFGRTTPSFDLETGYDHVFPFEHITRERCEETLRKFLGRQLQTPPVYSAKNIMGSRAYEYARKGKTPHLLPVEIEILDMTLLEFVPPRIKFRVVCSKGTYIRVLAHDIGKDLDSGAHLVELVRTRIGKFSIDEAISVQEFEEKLKKIEQNRNIYV